MMKCLHTATLSERGCGSSLEVEGRGSQIMSRNSKHFNIRVEDMLDLLVKRIPVMYLA